MDSWVAQALPWFQIVSTVATALAAIAAWRSASAARFTAGKTDETARRATEALSRAIMPKLEILLSRGDDRSREPQQMALYVRNDAPNPCVIVGVKIERADGHPAVSMVGPPVRLGTRDALTMDNVAYLPLSGPIARLCPDAEKVTSTEETGPFLACAVDFTDAAGLVKWRQHIRFHERVGPRVVLQDGERRLGGEPVYSYDWRERPEPEIVSDGASSTSRPPGWVRRTWHRVW